MKRRIRWENKNFDDMGTLRAACGVDHAVLSVLNPPTNNDDLELISSQFQHAVDSLSNPPLP